MSRDDGGPAFPVELQIYKGRCADEEGRHRILEPEQYSGMTLRDYFAAKVLQGMWANENVCGSAEELAQGAYAGADAMLAERAK